MTVKILKAKPKLKLDCKGCRSKLEFEFTDLVGAYFEHDYTEAGPQGVGVKCPDCGTLTEYKKAPAAVIESVWDKKARDAKK